MSVFITGLSFFIASIAYVVVEGWLEHEAYDHIDGI
jgi:hypothetical protein